MDTSQCMQYTYMYLWWLSTSLAVMISDDKKQSRALFWFYSETNDSNDRIGQPLYSSDLYPNYISEQEPRYLSSW